MPDLPEMTELQRGEIIRGWIELMQNQGVLVNADSTMMFTLLFGYLLVAYFVGKNLSRSQTLILTVLYIIAFVVTLGNIVGSAYATVTMKVALIQVCPECTVSPLISVEAIFMVATVNAAMLGASLYFMWNVRHPKIE
jgi:hypothetical protein